MASEMYHLITKQVKQPDEFANSFNLQGGALSEVCKHKTCCKLLPLEARCVV